MLRIVSCRFQTMRLLQALLIALVFAFALPAAANAQVDINQADAKTLANALVGVGLVKAEAIVAWPEDDRSQPRGDRRSSGDRHIHVAELSAARTSRADGHDSSHSDATTLDARD